MQKYPIYFFSLLSLSLLTTSIFFTLSSLFDPLLIFLSSVGCGGGQKVSSYATSATTGGEVRSPSAKELLEAGVRVCFFFEIFFTWFFLIFACGPHKHPHANLIFTCRYTIRMEKSWSLRTFWCKQLIYSWKIVIFTDIIFSNIFSI